MTKKDTQKKSNTVLSKSNDGTIQITFTIPQKIVLEQKTKSIEKLGATIQVAGFRKGKAPADKVIEKLPETKLKEDILSSLLPGLFSEAVKKYNIRPVIFPKFDVLKIDDDTDWQVRATTCEMPDINLGDYKKLLKGSFNKSTIWTPQSPPDDKKEKEKPTKQEKEQEIIKILLEKIDFEVPKVLVQDEVNARLSRLLEKIEKLGLTLESYLSSLGKTADSLRGEYEKQASETIKLDFILTEIARKENVKVTSEQVNEAIKAAGTSPELTEKLNTPEQRKVIESILTRRSALDLLSSFC